VPDLEDRAVAQIVLRDPLASTKVPFFEPSSASTQRPKIFCNDACSAERNLSGTSTRNCGSTLCALPRPAPVRARAKPDRIHAFERKAQRRIERPFRLERQRHQRGVLLPGQARAQVVGGHVG